MPETQWHLPRLLGVCLCQKQTSQSRAYTGAWPLSWVTELPTEVSPMTCPGPGFSGVPQGCCGLVCVKNIHDKALLLGAWAAVK
jgi:hypothetical protein